MRRAGTLDLQADPVVSVLGGSDRYLTDGWMSAFRGVGPAIPGHLDLRERSKADRAADGFTLLDFAPASDRSRRSRTWKFPSGT